MAAVSARGVANLSLRASLARFKNVMRPTGEASKPVSTDFVCRFRYIGSSSSELHRRLAEPQAPGFQAVRPYRVDS